MRTHTSRFLPRQRSSLGANGEALDVSKQNYTLTFARDQFPPVNSFWSVTMCDGKTQLLVANPINRFLINSPSTRRCRPS
jgi:hypothetical protein